MRARTQQSVWLILAGLILLTSPFAWAQVTIGDETHVNLTGDASFGYNGVFSDTTADQQQYGFGGIFTLAGYYHHPNFLSFRVSPYYNQSRLNSDFNTFFTSKGMTATANVFSGSAFPGEVTYERRFDSEGQFGIPGVSSFTSGGDSTSFGIGWGFTHGHLPPVRATFSLEKGSNDILGLTQRAIFNSRTFGVSSYYTLAGFNLSGSYTNSSLDSTTPTFIGPNESLQTATHEHQLQFNANRRLTSWANFGAVASRTNLDTDYAGTLSNETFNTVSATLDIQPNRKLDVVAGVNYATSLNAILLQSFFRTNPSTPLPPLVFTKAGSDYENYSIKTDYRITQFLFLDGGVEYILENFLGTDLKSQRERAGIGFFHSFLGGQVNAHYGFSALSLESSRPGTPGIPRQNREMTVNAASVGYTHRFDFHGWRNSGNVQFSTNAETALLGYSANALSANMTGSHGMGQWTMTLSSSLFRNNISGLSNSSNFGMNYSAAISNRKLAFSGNYAHSTGNSFQTAGGLIASPLPGQLLFPQLLVFYGGDSYSFSGSYSPTRRLRVTGNLTHTLFETTAVSSLSNNVALRYESKAEYSFRQMRMSGGYSHISQGLGASFNHPTKVDAIFFGVTRHFDIF